ncbi:MAG: hypothetical protein NDI63_12305 [Pseudobdellovibrio sp.]|nr:hypothetical protein [Pseudobdellovibrio sp.]
MDLPSTVSAISTFATAILTYYIWKATKAQAQTASALQAIESQRDSAEDPRVFIFVDGYHPETQVASFVMQNSGKKSLFLRSLRIYSSGMEVEMFNMDSGPKNDRAMVSKEEIRDLVITPNKVEKFYFKLKNGSGQHFELLAQLYMGSPARIKINPSYLNGYELRAMGGTELKAYFRGQELNRDGEV